MRKPFVIVSVAASVAVLSALAYGVSLFFERKIDGSIVDLAGLYIYRGREGGTYPNFLQMTDNSVVFFVPVVERELSAVMRGEKSEYLGLFQIFSPSARTSKLAVLAVKKNGDTLQFGSYRAKDSELERLMLSPPWLAALNFSRCHKECVRGSSIVRLKNGQFLITGGTAEDTSGKGSAFPQTGTVFDSASNTEVKSFQLCHSWNNHLSLVLPDRKILLVGNMPYYVNSPSDPTVEIVDATTGTSRSLKCKTISYGASPTACLDRSGNCILFGGAGEELSSDAQSVERIDIQKEEISKIADLKIPRHFKEMGQNFITPINAIYLTADTILISGGRAYKSDLLHLYGHENLTNAEIVTLSK